MYDKRQDQYPQSQPANAPTTLPTIRGHLKHSYDLMAQFKAEEERLGRLVYALHGPTAEKTVDRPPSVLSSNEVSIVEQIYQLNNAFNGVLLEMRVHLGRLEEGM